MSALTGPVHLLAAVLVISGLQKVGAPAAAADAMRDARLPIPFRGRAVTGVALGLVEATIGIAALAVPHRAALAALGAFYAALTIFVLRLRRTDGSAGCGCFGAASTPPGVAHLVSNSVAALVAAVATVVGVDDIVEVVDAGAAVVVPYGGLVVTGAVLVLTAPALLAQIDATRRAPSVPTFRPRSSR